MQKARQIVQWFGGILGIIGISLLTSCDSSSSDIVMLPVVNQTGVALAMYVDDNDTPELTVPAHASEALVFSAGETHQLQWQGGAIQGQVGVTLLQNETRKLTIWGSGNAYSLK